MLRFRRRIRLPTYVALVSCALMLSMPSNISGGDDSKPPAGGTVSNPEQRSPQDLWAIILAGVRNSREKLDTGDFEADEAVVRTGSNGSVVERSSRSLRELIDRGHKRLRYEYRERDLATMPLKGPKDGDTSPPTTTSVDLEAIWLALPDVSVSWWGGRNNIALFAPGDHRQTAASRPLDPFAVGFMTATEVIYHWSNEELEAWLAERATKHQLTVVREGGSFRVDIVTAFPGDKATVEFKRQTWVDARQGFIPVKTEERRRRLTKDKIGDWSKPLTTTVRWRTINGITVPVAIEAVDCTAVNGDVNTLTAALEWKSINQPVDDVNFDFHKFGAPVGTPVIDARINSHDPVVVETIGAISPHQIVKTLAERRRPETLGILWAVNIGLAVILVAILMVRRLRRR